MRTIAGFVAAVLAMLALGAFTATQYDLSALAQVGAPISMDQRLALGTSNIAAMGQTYGPLIAVSFLIAFVVAGLTVKPLPLPRPMIYAAAGFVAIWAFLVLSEAVFFGVPIISGARSFGGLLAQCVMGGIAGLVYAGITRQARA